jgi:chromosome segregation ATPase
VAGPSGVELFHVEDGDYSEVLEMADGRRVAIPEELAEAIAEFRAEVREIKGLKEDIKKLDKDVDSLEQTTNGVATTVAIMEKTLDNVGKGIEEAKKQTTHLYGDFGALRERQALTEQRMERYDADTQTMHENEKLIRSMRWQLGIALIAAVVSIFGSVLVGAMHFGGK